MSRISANRNKAKLRQAWGIRARLVLFVLILVGPLMAERVRSLQSSRDIRVEQVRDQFYAIGTLSEDTRHDVTATVTAVLRSSGYIYRSAGNYERTCQIMSESLHNDLPWVRNLAIADKDGKVQCTTGAQSAPDMPESVGKQTWFRRALGTDQVVISDFFFPSVDQAPALVAAYRAAGVVSDETDATIIAVIDLKWMSDLLGRISARDGINALLVDQAGTVLAAPESNAALIGNTMPNPGLLNVIAAQIDQLGQSSGNLTYTTTDGDTLAATFIEIPGSTARMIATIDQSSFSAAANQNIRTAYLQFGVVCLFVLFGALVTAERLIIRPIEKIATMAKQFGSGDWSARKERHELPVEFTPLIRSLYGMAAQLRHRERELRANNDRLRHMATVDVLSGLNNRRAFQQQLDTDWARSSLDNSEISLVMLDVDYFKQYNDTLGHLRGDDCIAAIGQTLRDIARVYDGFAARYGGEEFCILLPDTNADISVQIAEEIRLRIAGLRMPHPRSREGYVTVSVGVATARPATSTKVIDLIDAADAALYSAKGNGRDRVVQFHSARPEVTTAPLWPA